MYFTMYFLGAVAAVMSVAFRCKKYTLSWVKPTITEVIVVIIAVLSGKVLFALENLMLEGQISFSGIRIYGLIYSVPIMCFLLKKYSGLSWTDTLALCTPGLALSSSFARLGCQYAGCCGGPPIWFGGLLVDIPEQLLEGLFDLILFYVLLKMERHEKKEWMYPVYLLSYAIMRFGLEFLRDSKLIVGCLTIAHLISIASIFIALVWMVTIKKYFKQNKHMFRKEREHG